MEGLSKIIKGLGRSSTSPHGSSCCKDNPIQQQYSLSSARNRSSSNDGLDSPSTPAVGSPQCRRKWSFSSDSIKCDCEGNVQRAEAAPGSSSSTTYVFDTIHNTTKSRQEALSQSSSGPFRQQARSASFRRLKRRVIWSAKMLHKASKVTSSASAAAIAGPQALSGSSSLAAYSVTGCEQQQQQFSPTCSPAGNQPLLTTANTPTNEAPSKSSNSTPATQLLPLAMKQLQSHSSSDSAGNTTTAIAPNSSSSSSNTLPHSSLKSACLQILRASSAGSSSSSDSSSVCSGYQPLPLPAQAAAPSFNDDSTLQGRWQGVTAAGHHPDALEPEIQPWSDSTDEDSLSGRGQSAAAASEHPGRPDPTSSSPDEAHCMDVESLFDSSLPRSDSFTTTCYNTSKGQKVAVVRLGSVITSVFVREPTGEVWECPPDQVIIPQTHHSQPATSHNPQPHSAAAAAAAQQHSSSTVLTAEAAAKLYVSMNGGNGSTHSHRKGSAAGSADSSFSSRNSSRCSHSSSSPSPRHHSQCSTGAAGTPVAHLHSATEASTAQSAGMTANPTSSHRNRIKGGVHAWGLQAAFSYVKSSFQQWQQQRKLRKQCQAAAYIDAIDDAAHVAMRVAGCHSFVLPRYWPDSARKAVRQQRRLRVLLTAYKA